MHEEQPLWRRILDRLWRAELSEVNPHFQADLRIAWITVWLASHGDLQPHVAASYAVLGKHPSQVWPAIVAKRRALLGREYSLFYDSAGNWKPEPLADPWCGESPRKPPQTVKEFPPPPEADEAA